MTHNEVSGAWRMARILRVLRTARMARLVRLMPEQHDWHIFSVNLVSIFGQPGGGLPIFGHSWFHAPSFYLQQLFSQVLRLMILIKGMIVACRSVFFTLMLLGNACFF